MPREGTRKIAVVLVYLLVVVLVLGKIARAAEGNPDEVKVEIVPIDIATQMVVDFSPVFQTLANSLQKFLIDYYWLIGGLFIVAFIASWHQGALSAKYIELRAYEEREARIAKHMADQEEKDEAKRRLEEQKAEHERQLHKAEVEQMKKESTQSGWTHGKFDIPDGQNVERHVMYDNPDGEPLEMQLHYDVKREAVVHRVNGEITIDYVQKTDTEFFEGDEPADRVMRLATEKDDTIRMRADASFDTIINDVVSEQEAIRNHQKNMFDAFGRRPPKRNRVVRQPSYDDCGY